MSDRAYFFFNGQWKHVYILDRYEQRDIFGGGVLMCKIKLVKNTQQTIDVEADKLQSEKPRRSRRLS